LHTVNGSISIGDRGVVNSATTVNGSVRVGDDCRAKKLSTVNGRVVIGNRTVISGDVVTVNGRIELGENAVVDGNVKNVNSQITLGRSAHVGNQVITSTGDITLENNARVDKGIRVRESDNWFSSIFGGLFDVFSHTPVVTIGPGAQVDGELVFEREVELKVHSTAKIGPVKGAKVQRY
ncbi:MAG TPA: hypothetical protein VET48_10150, partial [Steroidobacteraceae bacterium]|nr:hypothetical protein [Steroidobacteraceae bacterium]